MKNNLLIDQRSAMAAGLDLVDWILVDWFIAKSPAYIGAVPVNFKEVLEDLPLLPIKSRDGIYRRFMALAEVDILREADLSFRGPKTERHFYPGTRLSDLLFSSNNPGSKSEIGQNNLGSKSEIRPGNSDLNPRSRPYLGSVSEIGVKLGSKSEIAAKSTGERESDFFGLNDGAEIVENFAQKTIPGQSGPTIYIENSIKRDNLKDTEREGMGERAKTKKGAHTFKNSPISTTETFRAAFLGTKYEIADLDYYFEAVSSWAESKDVRRADWIAQARNFMIRDVKSGTLKRPGVIGSGSGMDFLKQQFNTPQQ